MPSFWDPAKTELEPMENFYPRLRGIMYRYHQVVVCARDGNGQCKACQVKIVKSLARSVIRLIVNYFIMVFLDIITLNKKYLTKNFRVYKFQLIIYITMLIKG